MSELRYQKRKELDLQRLLNRLTVGSSFGLTFWTRTEIGSGCSHFQPDPSRVAHIFNPTRPDPTGNWVNPTRPAKDPSLASRGLNIENFPVFGFCITFLHYLLIESHKGEHEGRLVGSHKGEHGGRLVGSHKGEHGGRLVESHKGKHGGRLIGSHDGKHEEEHEGEHRGEHGGENEGEHEESHGGEHEGEHRGEHEGSHGGEHEGKTWRPFDFGRESWRGNMVGSHEGNHEGCSTKLFTPI